MKYQYGIFIEAVSEPSIGLKDKAAVRFKPEEYIIISRI